MPKPLPAAYVPHLRAHDPGSFPGPSGPIHANKHRSQQTALAARDALRVLFERGCDHDQARDILIVAIAALDNHDKDAAYILHETANLGKFASRDLYRQGVVREEFLRPVPTT